MSETPTTPPSLSAGTIVAERYRVQRMLGEGAMGVVYLVEHVHMRKRMALKVLQPSLTENAEIVARFEREAVAAAHIDHPNVVAATDFGRTEQGAFFLVLEFVDGKSLRDVVEAPLEIGRVVRITKQIASALSRAHQLGIVHRDLKPENVMLVEREGEAGEVVKVLDFGIAKLDADVFGAAGALPSKAGAQPLTRMGTIFGTPDYMAPEQALGETVDARADLYAVGVMLYEMLTGLRPFEADNVVTLLGKQVAEPVPPMRVRAPNVPVPPALEAIARRLLEKKPADRFASAAELEAALDDAARGEGLSLPSMPRIATAPIVEPTPSSRVIVASGNMPLGTMNVGSSPTVHAATAADLGKAPWRVTAPLRTMRPAVLLAGLAVLVIGPIVALTFALRGADAIVGADGGPPAKSLWSRAPVLDDARVQAAATAGPDALEDLAKRFPEDRRPVRELVRVYESQGRLADAARAVGRLATLDPAPLDAASERALVAALEGPPDAVDAAVLALEGPLGARGVDLLIDLTGKTARGASRHALTPATQKRLAQSLASPEVRAHASDAATVVLELRDAKRCDTKKSAVEHAKAGGDERALPYLKPLQARGGCGFLGVADCWGCLHHDDTLSEAIAAVEARTHAQDRDR